MDMDHCVLLKKEKINKILLQHPKKGKSILKPLTTPTSGHNFPLKVLEDTNILNEAEIHTDQGDLWGCLQGKVKFIYGGKLINKYSIKKEGRILRNELRAKGIKYGKRVTLKPGDWLWIPPGQPHSHHCSGTSRLIIIKIPLQK